MESCTVLNYSEGVKAYATHNKNIYIYNLIFTEIYTDKSQVNIKI